MTFPSQLWAMTPMSMGYINKVLKPNSSVGYDPSSLVGFWPQNEKSGLVSLDHSGLGHHGAYQGVDLGQAGVPGMGMTSPFYDGASGLNNLYSAGLANDNLLLNPGFETPGGGGPDIWDVWEEQVTDGALANEVVLVYEGLDAAKLTGGVGQSTRVQQTITVVPNTTYRIRFYTRGDGVNAGRTLLYDITNGALIEDHTTTGVPGIAYAGVVKEFIAPAGCVSVSLRLECPPANGGVCYYDACEVRGMDGFVPDELTLFQWLRVRNAGVWTDGSNDCPVHFGADSGANFVRLLKGAAGNNFQWSYVAGGVSKSRTFALSETDWMCMALTVSMAADELNAFLNGVAFSAPMTGLGTWVGALAPNLTLIGGQTTTPGLPWNGWLGPTLVYNEAKTPAEVEYLSTP